MKFSTKYKKFDFFEIVVLYLPISISILSDCFDKTSKIKLVKGPETNFPLLKFSSEKKSWLMKPSLSS